MGHNILYDQLFVFFRIGGAYSDPIVTHCDNCTDLQLLMIQGQDPQTYRSLVAGSDIDQPQDAVVRPFV